MNDFQARVQHYMSTYDSFESFGVTHLCTLAITAVLAVAIPWLSRRGLRKPGQLVVGCLLGSLVALSYLGWATLDAIARGFQIKEHLPLHLCWAANLMFPIVMATRSRLWFEVIYYWGLAAGILASLTPTVWADFPHARYLAYVGMHNGMVITLIYGLVVYEIRPTAAGILRAFVAGNVLLLVAAPVDYLFGANYLFLAAKPKSPISDYLGPWPWYILIGEVVALLHFVAAYVPIWVWNWCSPPDGIPTTEQSTDAAN